MTVVKAVKRTYDAIYIERYSTVKIKIGKNTICGAEKDWKHMPTQTEYSLMLILIRIPCVRNY